MLITRAHTALGIDPIWTGLEVEKIIDLEILITWWNLVMSKAGDKVSGKIYDKGLQEFHCSLWIRINQLHPKYLLRYEDLRR